MFSKKFFFTLDKVIGFQNAEARFQNAETRFLNAENQKSRIFFARTWMDFAQKFLHLVSKHVSCHLF